MHEHGSWILLSAVLCSVASMGWLALAMPVHAAQVWGGVPKLAALLWLRWLGAAGIVVALALCLFADHASMAVLVWAMALSGAALLIAFLLAWHPGCLRLLAPWLRAAA